MRVYGISVQPNIFWTNLKVVWSDFFSFWNVLVVIKKWSKVLKAGRFNLEMDIFYGNCLLFLLFRLLVEKMFTMLWLLVMEPKLWIYEPQWSWDVDERTKMFRKNFWPNVKKHCCSDFEITRTIYSNRARSEQLLKTDTFWTCYWRTRSL